jgi:hypothetical protein
MKEQKAYVSMTFGRIDVEDLVIPNEFKGRGKDEDLKPLALGVWGSNCNNADIMIMIESLLKKCDPLSFDLTEQDAKALAESILMILKAREGNTVTFNT